MRCAAPRSRNRRVGRIHARSRTGRRPYLGRSGSCRSRFPRWCARAFCFAQRELPGRGQLVSPTMTTPISTRRNGHAVSQKGQNRGKMHPAESHHLWKLSSAPGSFGKSQSGTHFGKMAPSLPSSAPSRRQPSHATFPNETVPFRWLLAPAFQSTELEVVSMMFSIVARRRSGC